MTRGKEIKRKGKRIGEEWKGDEVRQNGTRGDERKGEEKNECKRKSEGEKTR